MNRAILILCLALFASALAPGCRVTEKQVGLIEDLGSMPPTTPVPGEEPPRPGRRVGVEESGT